MTTPAPTIPRARFGPFELDAAAGDLRKAGVLIKLQPQPFRILQFLIERNGTVVTREDIQNFIWNGSVFVDFEHAINFSINQIRSALADDAEKPRYIETLPRRGYRFIAPVTMEQHQEPGPNTGPVKVVDPLPASSPDVHLEPRDPAKTDSINSNLEVLPAAQPQVPVTTWRWQHLAILAVAITAAVGLTIGVARWPTGTRDFNLEKIEFRKLTNSGNAIAVAISPDGHSVVYALRSPEGVDLWLRQVATRSDVQILPSDAISLTGLTFSLDSEFIYFVRPEKNDPGFKYLYMMPVLGGPVRLLARDIDSAVSFSPDGRQIVYTRGDPPHDASEIRIAKADGGANRVLTTMSDVFAGFQPGAAWSPDGRTIAVAFMHLRKAPGYALYLVSLHDASVRQLYASDYAIGRPLWLPEGDGLLLPLEDRAGRWQLWKISYPQGQLQRLTNDLGNYSSPDYSAYSSGIDATRDAGTVVSIQSNLVSNIWVTPAMNPSGGRQITSGQLPMVGIAPAPQEKLVMASSEGELLTMNLDGSQVTPLQGVRSAGPALSCGRFLLFYAPQVGKNGLVRIEADGSNPTLLAQGPIWSFVCSKNHQDVFYGAPGQPAKIWRTPLEGGPPTEIATVLGADMVSQLNTSPDGQFLAYAYEEFTPEPVTMLAVIPVKGGPPERVLKALGGIYEHGCLRWSPDGKSLQFLLTEKGTTNIWEQSLAGGKPKQLTHFTSGRIFDFNWSSDHKYLLLARGSVSSDVVLLSHVR